MGSEKPKDEKPKDYALRLFRIGYSREEVIQLLKKWFTEKSDNALNIAMTRGAKLREDEMERDKDLSKK